ncbi:transcription antiterminator [Leuconostoc sp. MS02]|uniref:Transcription antiterminator n=1 Tax=Leuconostoc aquikimchii TaxID=3236804 RepID=A0ABV3S3L0_9LACO
MSMLENRVLMFLGQQVDFVTAQEISETLGSSTKTVYRSINKLNATEKVIASQRGRGYRLVKKVAPLTEEQQEVQRSLDLAIIILTQFPRAVKRWQLTDKLYMSDSTLSRYLSRLSTKLMQFKIQLQRSDGQVRAVGTEVQLRKALNYFLLEETRTKKALDNISDIFPNVSDHDRQFISAQMVLIETELAVQILDPYTINIFSHLYILIQRVRQKRYEEQFSSTNLAQYDEKLTHVARKIIDNLGQYLNDFIHPQEVENLLVYLVGLRYDRNLDESKDDEAHQLVGFIVQNMSLSKYVNRNNLKRGLLGHVRPMIHRITANMSIINPLLNDIKFNYEDVFTDIKKIIQKSSYTISDDEVGFLTLYVVRAIEDATNYKRVLIMCSTGVGTAQLLQTKVKHAFPDFDIVAVISSKTYQNNSKKYQDIDLVISTVQVSYHTVSPIIQVSALFNEGDKRRVAEMAYG